MRALLPHAPQLVGRLLRARDGVSTLLFALSGMVLIGSSALAIDVGNLYLSQRKLQGVADAAAMAAVNASSADPTTTVNAMIAASGVTGVSIGRLETGTYQRDIAVPVASRFSSGAGGSGSSAVRVTLDQQVPLFFGALLAATRAGTVHAQATATRANVTAFSLSTHLLAVTGGLENALLSALAGTTLSLQNSDIGRMTTTQVQIAGFADALRQQTGQGSATYNTVFGANQSMSDVVNAMAAATPDAATALVLRQLAGQVRGTVRPADVVDLGAFGQTDVNDGRVTASVDVWTLLRGLLGAGSAAPPTVVLSVAIAGVGNVTITIATGGAVHSPLLTVDAAQNYTLRTAQTRLLLSAGTGSLVAGLATLTVPVYLELASAQARLAQTSCTGTSAADGATVGVTPSIGTAAIAQPDMNQFGNFAAPLPLGPAVLANVVGLRVNAWSVIQLGGTSEQSVGFSRAEIDAHTVKEVATNDLVQGVAASLVSRVAISATTPLGTVNAGPVVSAVGSQLQVLAPALDGLINELTGALGVRLGVADVSIDQLRCGVPQLM